jgi:hypothetical protein
VYVLGRCRYADAIGGSAQVRDVENTMPLSSVREDVEGLIHKVAFLQGELAEPRWAWVVAEEKIPSLSEHQLMVHDG